jgi:hypothetical protein
LQHGRRDDDHCGDSRTGVRQGRDGPQPLIA